MKKWDGFYITSEKGYGVAIINRQDSYYRCVLETREEVNEFIKELVEKRDKVFGKEK